MTLAPHPLDIHPPHPRPRARWPRRLPMQGGADLSPAPEATMEDHVNTPATKTQRRHGQARPPQPPAADPSDYDTREGLNARRNVLFGLWAARRLGLQAHEQDAFAWNVHFADLSEPGHDDVIEVVARAFKERGVEISDRALRTQLREMTLRALYDLSAGGPRR
jgi:hypothetical protein